MNSPFLSVFVLYVAKNANIVDFISDDKRIIMVLLLFFIHTRVTMKRNKNCVVYITHRINPGIKHQIKVINNATKMLFDFIVLFDENSIKDDMVSELEELKAIPFDSSQIDGFFFKGNKALPNPLLALIELSRKENYEHYMVIENDILYKGKWEDFFFKILDAENMDYLHIASDSMGGPTLHYPFKYIENNPYSDVYFSWSQLFYISRSFLLDIEYFLSKNDSFYYEFLLPTMAYNSSYRISQFENYGFCFKVSWGPADKYEDLYKNEKSSRTFYHPIKDVELLKGSN